MRILLAAVGRAGRRPEGALYEHYASRITPSLDLKEVEEKRPLSSGERKRREAALLLGALPKGATVVALDGKGRRLTSAAFADKLAGWRDSGVRDLAFVIGGADGLDRSVLEGAHLILSLGDMTWPHLLVRALLAEQIYRAQCILAGHPYHRG